MSDEDIIEKLNKIVKEKETMYWSDEIKSALDLINRQRAEIERLNKTIENIEKQIPKEVVTRKIDEDIKLDFCPRCNVRFIKSGMKYCGECGQALDWERKEE